MDSLGEELRVLYVALTRAKEKLIITGTIPNLEKKMPLYEMGITFGRLSKASTYWDWILPAVSSVPPEVPIAVKRIAFDDIVKDCLLYTSTDQYTDYEGD